jgi:hypothetical protein
MEFPLDCAGLTAVNAKPDLLFTVMLADKLAFPAATFTVPPVTMMPVHVRLPVLELRATVFPLASVKIQSETVVPDGPDTVHVAELPLVIAVVHDRLATLVGPLGPSGTWGQYLNPYSVISPLVFEVVLPMDTPV